jgi:DDE superfamily endonuclease
VFAYCVMLDVPRDLLSYVSRLLHRERARRGTRRGTRRLTCYRQAMFVLAWFRDKPDVGRLGAGFGLSRATAYRYRDEGIAVLAAQAPDLHEALERAKAQGLSHLILDGKIIDTDRVTEPKLSRKGKQIDAWYAGKTRDFGGLIQALMNPRGIPLWVSDVMPGSVHDLTAARELVLAILAPYQGDLPVLADGGYEGAGHGVLVPVKTPKDGGALDPDTRTYNKLLRALRCLGERGFALLVTRWKTLQHVTISPRRITDLARAALVLTQFEHKMITQ